MFAIKQMRQRAGMTQIEAARAIGVSRSRYSNWELEIREINLSDAIRVADAFNCTLDELAGRRQPEVGNDETELLRLYRNTDSRGRAAIMRTAIGEAGVEREIKTDIIA